jgi:hypothetical protein
MAAIEITFNQVSIGSRDVISIGKSDGPEQIGSIITTMMKYGVDGK